MHTQLCKEVYSVSVLAGTIPLAHPAADQIVPMVGAAIERTGKALLREADMN